MTQQSFEFDAAADVSPAPVSSFDPDEAAPDADAPADRDASAETMSIAEAIDAVNDALTSGLGGLVWVRGEVHHANVSKGHRYFELVDDAPGNADVRQRPKVSAQLFAQTYQRIQPRLERAGVKLAEGVCVRMRGSFEVFARTGRFNFRVVDIDPEFTIGNLALQRDRLMRTLAAEQLLDANAQVALPLVPLRVGVVSSGGSEGWHDFRTNLAESGIGFAVELAHTLVQGSGAPMQVARTIRRLAGRDDLDVIAVVRGGGSKSDLATFDHEYVARAIATSNLPVITGIGHDNDRSVADEVAHAACKTPTACAQLLIDRVRQFERELDRRTIELGRKVARRLAACDRAIAERASAVRRTSRRAVGDAERAIVGRRRELGTSTRRTLFGSSSVLRTRHGAISTAARRVLRAHSQRLERQATAVRMIAPRALTAASSELTLLAAKVDAVDPRVALARGWSITTTIDGRLVRSTHDVTPGDPLATRVRDGQVRSTVTDVHADDTRGDDG